MLQQPSATPAGPRSSRPPTRPASSRLTNRGGIQKRNASTPARVDKDGDLVMGSAGTSSRTNGGRRGGVHPGAALNQRHKSTEPSSARTTRVSKTGIDTSAIQKAVLRGMGAKDTVSKGHRSGLRSGRGREIMREGGGHLHRIKVWGLKHSKAISNADGGISDLIAFLERKATNPDAPAREAVKIKKSHLEGDALIISVRPEDAPKLTRLDQYTFAGTQLTIEDVSRKPTPPREATDPQTPNTIEVLKSLLSRRYNVEAKLLDLSQLGTDPELVNIGMFNTTSRESKFFPALMKICDGLFATNREKEEAVVSVSLASNSLSNISSVTTLSQTFPGIRNLDLSNNQFPNLTALDGWRWKFPKLDHLILSGNPLEATVPTFKEDIMKWYPTLTTINNNQVRTQKEVESATKGKLPLPTLGPSFRDEASIAEQFVKQFFPAYDMDRAAVANGYYDAQSTFSLSINTSAPRSLNSTTHQPAGWDQYIKRSRNLIKISHTPVRMSRLYTGPESIKDTFATLPTTRHPDLLAEPHKWCIECHTIPGVPDPTGQSASGVGGLMVMVHGEFSEVNVSTGQTTHTRSFDRTFVLGPGGGIGGIRVASDILVLRAYGGSEAWKPDEAELITSAPTQPQQSRHQIPIPEGFGLVGPGKTDEQVQKEALAVDLSQATGMTLEYSGMCLQQSGWNLEGAMVTFEQAKANLPADAFVVK